ncbi:hypothetical protein TTHERM_000402199 (macronuclear) [Tetrahymena thermophila SB210]|uniref:Uncharacterized protein n=1 Tax=Tetrahymena thermophila (strain SB210) TaxID=312017 RepID=W7XIP7_TETTS|nr:hypothetical protein TTHERM_000402199 [Tetrahymena thermophila SB210]EWS74796.1 hypothetical protein TTHERM_000402199 [Tetrahymena thermophila SB210]|eukprot:XP_012652689.1 hypothetical protein TTHERM_000402199 [Tetrahymena thermophila SB210]
MKIHATIVDFLWSAISKFSLKQRGQSKKQNPPLNKNPQILKSLEENGIMIIISKQRNSANSNIMFLDQLLHKDKVKVDPAKKVAIYLQNYILSSLQIRNKKF